jgi:hypothetical protein
VLEDCGKSPSVVLECSSAGSTLQDLGLFPGGALEVITSSSSSCSSSSSSSSASASASASATTSSAKRPLPSELLSSHLDRFDDAPALAPAPKANVLGSGGIVSANHDGSVQGATAASIAKCNSAKTSKGKAVAGTVRRVLMKQKAVGRSNLRQEDRFHLEILPPPPPAAAAGGAAPQGPLKQSPAESTSSSSGGGGGGSHFMYFPRLWTLGEAMEDIGQRLRLGDGAALRFVPVVTRSRANLSSCYAAYLNDLEKQPQPQQQQPQQEEEDDEEDDEAAAALLQEFDTVQLVPIALAPAPVEQITAKSQQRSAAAAAVPPASAAPGSGQEQQAAAPAVPPIIPLAAASSSTIEGLWSLHIKQGKEVFPLHGLNPQTDTIETLKQRLVSELGKSTDNVKFIYKGTLDEATPLCQIKVLKNGAKITMMASSGAAGSKQRR